MRPITIDPPGEAEYASFYQSYVGYVSDRDAHAVLRRQVSSLEAACRGMTSDEALFRYAPRKWSIKQVIGHLSDAERIFSYRLLRISRGDTTPLASFDENAYVDAGEFDRHAPSTLLEDFRSARAATLALIELVSPHAWVQRGTASGATVTTRALAHIIAGHVEHHFTILRERYGLAVPQTGTPREVDGIMAS